ncbi:hypothetical protein SAMN05216187_11090 [Jeotgalicoccus aerolatus]|uniref:Uncharacterized protein n=1 Tax=Jeotgalicoccus aerolatus TaxID=709510 RepID=A0A1G9CXZ3_9STAP|nr:hypothetical protein [Jeotgalicoccus aerolatus]SDK56541.1 hypothetical protein SAMN05216187_11090 [Jeotgalicoccus aerolatus]
MTPKYTTINQFCEIAGMKRTFFSEQVLHHHLFREFVFKPQKKFFIETEQALKVLSEVFRDLEQTQ